MKKMFLLATLTSLMVSCSSAKKEEKAPEERVHEDIQRDYKVIDASGNSRPGWIEDAETWAKTYDKETEKFRFFSYETEPKVSRDIACNLAKANAKADIAGEIVTFIDKQLGSSTQGDASIDENNPKIKSLKSFVENTLAEKIQTLLNGAAVTKTYWEKRSYLEKLGAKKDFMAYTCAVLVRIDSKQLARAIDDAANQVMNQADDPEVKENVKKALDKASEKFDKVKK